MPGFVVAAAVAGFTLAACLVAQLVSSADADTLLIWPASGIALAIGLLKGATWIPAAAFGAACWAALGGFGLPTILSAFLVSAVGPMAAVHLLRRFGDWKPVDDRLDSSVRFGLAALLVSAPIDALIATIGFAPQWQAPAANLLEQVALWWLVDALGLLLFTPALLLGAPALRAARRHAGARTGVEHPVDPFALTATLFILVLAIGLALFGQDAFANAILFLYFPIVAWTAVRCGRIITSWTLLATGLPLLAVRDWLTDDAAAVVAGLEASAPLLCAVLVTSLLQAVAADRRHALAKMARLAHQDMSTQLFNDRGLMAELGETLARAERADFGLLGIQVTNFAVVNDLCGAVEAMHVEQRIADLLRRQNGYRAAARLSAGRFALTIEADSVNAVRAVARELYSRLNGNILRSVHGSVRQQVCVAGLLVDRHAMVDDEDCLLALSDAMAIAGSVRDLQLFVEPLSQTMIDARRSHQARTDQIREAIEAQRFSLHAQPISDPDTPAGTMSYEILLRLIERDGSLIRPPEFLSLAIQAQMTPAMDRGVVRAVFAWLAAHPEALQRTWRCAINLSGLTICDGTIGGFIREQRALHDIPASKIAFEIAESEAIRNPGGAARLVDELKAEGFGVAMDDFGSGLATFESLKRFPLDYLKIDGSYIRNLTNSPIDEEIVLSTVRVARRLNVRTVAEHVHTTAIRERLDALGVEHLQGELIGHPRPLHELFGEQEALIAQPAAA